MRFILFLTLLASMAFAGDKDRSLIAYQVKANVIGLDLGGMSTSGSADIMYSFDPAVTPGLEGTRLAGFTHSGSTIFLSGSYGFDDQIALEVSTTSGTETRTIGATPAFVTKNSGMGDVITSFKFRLDNGSLFARVSAGLGMSPGKQVYTTNASDPNETGVNNYSGGFSSPIHLHLGVMSEGFNLGAHLGYNYRGTRTVTPASGLGDSTVTGGMTTYAGLFAEYTSEMWGVGLSADSANTAVSATTDFSGVTTNTAGNSLTTYSLLAAIHAAPSFSILVGAAMTPMSLKLNSVLYVDPKYNQMNTSLTARFMF